METVKLQSRVGKDGILKLEVPVNMTDTDLEVLLVVQPIETEQTGRDKWLDFLEQTAGILGDDPMARPPQGDYEVREPVE